MVAVDGDGLPEGGHEVQSEWMKMRKALDKGEGLLHHAEFTPAQWG
jgi:hypothetical protein